MLIFRVLIISFCFCSCSKKEDESTAEDNSNTPAQIMPDQNSKQKSDPPATFTISSTLYSINESPVISWSPVDNAVGYEVAIGTRKGAQDVLGWTETSEASITVKGLVLQHGQVYHVSIHAVFADGSHSENNSDGLFTVDDPPCPVGFIKVPGDDRNGLGGEVYTEGTKTDYDWENDTATSRIRSSFCVMKYEAKLEIDGNIELDGDDTVDSLELGTWGPTVYLDGDEVKTIANDYLVRAVSTHEGKPWVRVRRQAGTDVVGVVELCEALGSNYRLMANNHWQAIARSIEVDNANLNNTLGPLSAVNRGHSDGGDPLAADSDDDNGCSGLGSDTHDASTPDIDCSWHLNKRTHRLSNGEVIWDFSGNVEEFLRDDNSLSQSNSTHMGRNDQVYTVNGSQLKWGPSAEQLTNFYHTFTSSPYGALGWLADGTGGIVVRGGGYSVGSNAGIYAANLTLDNVNTFGDTIGFRCVYLTP